MKVRGLSGVLPALPAVLVLVSMAAAQPQGGIRNPNAEYPVPALTRPAAGHWYTDPVFGTRIRRVSSLGRRTCTGSACGFEVPTYSQLQAFNRDDTFMLLTSSDGYRVRRASDLASVLVFPSWRWRLPRWDPARRRILIHFNRDDAADVRLQKTDVVTRKTRDIFTFPDYSSILGKQSFDELSHNGRYLAGEAVRSDGRHELFLFDLVRRKIRLALRLDRLCRPDPTWGLLDPDWVAPSPLGRYLVVQWVPNGTARCNGLEAYNLTGQFAGRIVTGHGHGDLGVTRGGAEIFMTAATHPDGPNETGLAWYRLPGTSTAAAPHHVRLLDWKALMSHVSCQGPPGVCLITSSSVPSATCCRAGWQPFQQEVWLQYLTGGKKRNSAPVLRLAHHRSSEQGYWAQPHATLARDGRYALYGSDWGIKRGKERADPYLVRLP